MAWTIYEGGEPTEFHMPAWGWLLLIIDAIIIIPISILVRFASAVDIDIFSTNTNI